MRLSERFANTGAKSGSGVQIIPSVFESSNIKKPDQKNLKLIP